MVTGICVVESQLCERSPQTVFSLSCIPFSVSPLLYKHTCHIHRISNTSQFSYHSSFRLIAVPLRSLYDGIFPCARPDLHHGSGGASMVPLEIKMMDPREPVTRVQGLETKEPTWDDHIAGLFTRPFWIPEGTVQDRVTALWIKAMKGYMIDLESYESVKQWAVTTYDHLRGRSMPLPGELGEQEYFPKKACGLIRSTKVCVRLLMTKLSSGRKKLRISMNRSGRFRGLGRIYLNSPKVNWISIECNLMMFSAQAIQTVALRGKNWEVSTQNGVCITRKLSCLGIAQISCSPSPILHELGEKIILTHGQVHGKFDRLCHPILEILRKRCRRVRHPKCRHPSSLPR